ncbi:MAG TPA: glycosyltransferase [Pirellulaceae bacterium]|jgi:glycosyltransferase involved in cell wall biosynthesis
MIVRNEGHQLDECLTPIAGLFDEIVVVDTGSQDNTRQVAERYTSRVFDFPWCDDFSAARNESLNHARGNWIFWLDADDRISPLGAAQLSRLFGTLSEPRQAFLMQTVLHQDDQARDPERVTSHLRLFPRHPTLRWHRRVHEVLKPWPSALGHEVIFSDIVIDHLGYRDIRLTQRKLRRNARLLRMEFAITPDEPSVLMDLGSAYAQLGDSIKARDYLRFVLACKPRVPLLARRAYTTLAELDLTEGNFSEAAALLKAALQEFSEDEYLRYMYSEALYNLGQYSEARTALLSVLHQPRQDACFLVGAPRDIRGRLASLALGELLRVTGELREAEVILRGAANARPTDHAAWFLLGRLYIDWRDSLKLQEIKLRLTEFSNGSIFADTLEALDRFTQGQYLATEKCLQEVIGRAPGMTLLRVLRAECLHRRNAEPRLQMQACRDILRLQPYNRRARETLGRLEALTKNSICCNDVEQAFYMTVVAAPCSTGSATGFECCIMPQ